MNFLRRQSPTIPFYLCCGTILKELTDFVSQRMALAQILSDHLTQVAQRYIFRTRVEAQRPGNDSGNRNRYESPYESIVLLNSVLCKIFLSQITALLRQGADARAPRNRKQTPTVRNILQVVSDSVCFKTDTHVAINGKYIPVPHHQVTPHSNTSLSESSHSL